MKTAHRSASHAKRHIRADPFAMWKAIARTTGFNEDEQVACTYPARMSWERLKLGTATASDIETLTDVTAICIVATEHMDELVQETCEAARLAMVAIADRHIRVKRWGVDAAALRDLPPVIDLYEELLRHATGAQAEDWIKSVQGIKETMRGTK